MPSSTIDLAEARVRLKRDAGAFRAKDAAPVSIPNTSALESIDEENRTATFVMSDASDDRVGDVLVPTGVMLDQFMRNPQFLWGHDQDQLPIGKWLKVWFEDGKVKGQAWFATPDIDAGGDASQSFAEACWQMVKAGMLNAVSVCFLIHDADFTDTGLLVKQWELLECSLVTVPCNRNALINGKSFTQAVKGFASALETRMPESTEKTEPVKKDGDDADTEQTNVVDDSMAGHLKAAADHASAMGDLHKRLSKAVADCEAHAKSMGDVVAAVKAALGNGEDGDPEAKGMSTKGAGSHALSATQLKRVKSISKAAGEIMAAHATSSPNADGDPDGDDDAGDAKPEAEKAAPTDPVSAWFAQVKAAGHDPQTLINETARREAAKARGELD
jgi:HK97 family phage prohead protease